MTEVLQVRIQKQLIHYYRISFQEDQNEYLQKLLYLQNKSPLFAMSFPQQMKKATSTFWQNMPGNVEMMYMTNCWICFHSTEIFRWVQALHFYNERRIYFLSLKKNRKSNAFSEKQNGLFDALRLFQLCVPEKKHGINLKCHLLLWSCKGLCPFLKSSEHIKRQSFWSEAIYMNTAVHANICRKISYITYQMKSNAWHTWY